MDVDVEAEENEKLPVDADGTRWEVMEGHGLMTGSEARPEDLDVLSKRQ